MAASLYGLRSWELTRDQDGYREYKATFRVMTSNILDGPGVALRCPGLPRPGAMWSIGNDLDQWVWCRPNGSVKPILANETNIGFDIDLTFSNKPIQGKDKQKCHDSEVEDPLLQPQQLSGGTTNTSEEAAFDRFGVMITSSSHELLRGKPVEFDVGKSTLKISQNVPQLQLALCESMKNCVNAFPIYGLYRRMLKLSTFTWEMKFYGQCYRYYTRNFEFDIDYRTFDRDVLDEGFKAIHGENVDGAWRVTPIDGAGTMPNRFNPQHFVRYKDANGENIRTVLDGKGKPLNTVTNIKITFDQRSATWLTGTATIVVGENHELIVGDIVTVSGVIREHSLVDPGFNGEFTLTAVDDDTVQYAVTDDPGHLIDGLDWAATLVCLKGVTAQPGKIHIERYNEVDFLLLGIPVTFGD